MSKYAQSLIPDPVAVKSEVFTCYSCGAWWCRVPFWCGGEGIGEQCEKCGCTSVNCRPGRNWGPSSKDWPWLMEQWHDFVRLDMLDADDFGREHILEGVIMPQPELCECGHARWEHRKDLPAPCNHGRKDPLQISATHPDYGCRCCGFTPKGANP